MHNCVIVSEMQRVTLEWSAATISYRGYTLNTNSLERNEGMENQAALSKLTKNTFWSEPYRGAIKTFITDSNMRNALFQMF